MHKKIGAVVIASIYVVLVAIVSVYIHHILHSAGLCEVERLCVLGIPLYYFLPIFSAVGLVTGGVMFYLISEGVSISVIRCKREYEDKINEIYARLLDKDEYKILTLLKKNKKITQSKISKILGITRLQTFRAVKRLEEKGIVRREKKGKSINVYLTSS